MLFVYLLYECQQDSPRIEFPPGATLTSPAACNTWARSPLACVPVSPRHEMTARVIETGFFHSIAHCVLHITTTTTIRRRVYLHVMHLEHRPKHLLYTSVYIILYRPHPPACHGICRRRRYKKNRTGVVLASFYCFFFLFFSCTRKKPFLSFFSSSFCEPFARDSLSYVVPWKNCKIK